MDHPCHKCGQTVEDGVPFCAHCAAPQIRVAIAEPLPAIMPSLDKGSPENVPVGLPAGPNATELAIAARWSQALRPCALAAVVALVLVGLRLYPVVAIFTAGLLAVAFYRQSNPGTVVKA